MQEEEKEKYKIAKGKRKRRAFKRLLGDMNSNFNSALWDLSFCIIFPYRFVSSWAKLGLCFLKK